MKIINIVGKEILNSQGMPTISCEIQLEDGSYVKSSVPSGTSKSKYENYELYDGSKRLLGKGVLNAIEIINNVIAPKFFGKEPNAVEMDIQMLQMDGTPDKSNFGANTLLAVSMALYRAHALISDIELFDFIALALGLETVSLPIPMINFINGGLHADNNLLIQEYLIIPFGNNTVKSSIESSIVLFNSLKKLLEQHDKASCFGKEGGLSTKFNSVTEPLNFIIEAIKKANFDKDIFSIGLDVAASHFYDKQLGLYNFYGQKTNDEMIIFYKQLSKEYDLFSIEDGLDQDDWAGWIKLMNILGEQIHVIADDLFATNPEIISKGIKFGAANSVIIKPNQIGTITETLQAISLCKENGLSTIISHRSCDTNDTFIVDLAVGSNSNYIKCGGLRGGQNIAKYNRLLEIENILREFNVA